MTSRIGIGYDIHRLVEGRKLILGGLEIPYRKGLEGHSDADVLIHAICDALLGALGLGDIGEYFPDTDPQCQGIDSRQILKTVKQLIQDKGFRIGNIDAVVILEKPLLKPFKPKICSQLSTTLNIPQELVSVKAKTQEGLGFGAFKEEAVAVYAVALLVRSGDCLSDL